VTKVATPATAVRAVPPPAASPMQPPAISPRRSDALAPLRRFGVRVSRDFVPRVSWYVGRTGRPGLVGLALLAATAVFFFSTHQQIVGQAAELRGELAQARQHARSAPRTAASDAAITLDNLPQRSAMPSLLGVILHQAEEAQLSVDTGKYESSATKNGDITRYKIAFPVTGPYPQVRKFIDATLTALPSAAISDLRLERKSVNDGNVEAQVRLTVYTRSSP
jgi:Tfp pilus assembly protein PilO